MSSQDNIVDITGINVSSIKIKDINADEETILLKDGIVREFLSFFPVWNKDKYPQLLEIMSSFTANNEFVVQFMKESWRDFLNNCKDCEEKFKLLEIVDNIKE